MNAKRCVTDRRPYELRGFLPAFTQFSPAEFGDTELRFIPRTTLYIRTPPCLAQARKMNRNIVCATTAWAIIAQLQVQLPLPSLAGHRARQEVQLSSILAALSGDDSVALKRPSSECCS